MAYAPATAAAAYEWIRTKAAGNDFAQLVADELRSGSKDGGSAVTLSNSQLNAVWRKIEKETKVSIEDFAIDSDGTLWGTTQEQHDKWWKDRGGFRFLDQVVAAIKGRTGRK